MFKEYTAMVDSEESGYLRSLMDFDYPEQGVPLEEVESVDSIVKRFKTGAMSYGSISQEAHETLAVARTVCTENPTPVRAARVMTAWSLRRDVPQSNR